MNEAEKENSSFNAATTAEIAALKEELRALKLTLNSSCDTLPGPPPLPPLPSEPPLSALQLQSQPPPPPASSSSLYEQSRDTTLDCSYLPPHIIKEIKNWQQQQQQQWQWQQGGQEYIPVLPPRWNRGRGGGCGRRGSRGGSRGHIHFHF
ncbi:uncharacterized protein [Linepithema humile]|uniref:uncharacterized protein n=1 Tax=Linepithema humile TaxID=83485 RepID=UPI00351E64FC